MADAGKAPPPALDGATLEALRDAILAGYDFAQLDDRLHFRWGFELADELNVDQGFKHVVAGLLRLTEQQGRTLDLLALAWTGKPDNPKLRALAERLLPDPAAALALHGAAALRPAALGQPAGSLEALVRARSRLIDFGVFTERVAAIGRRLCRIDLPDSHGTGFLIGPAQLLTNYHVVKDVIERRVPATEVALLFDYWRPATAAPAPAGTHAALAADGIGPWRPYSPSDLSATGAPQPDELDFAVLNLATPIGETADRGWFVLSPRVPVVTVADVAMIPQHPQADPLKVAYGSVVALPGDGLRYRYDVTTDKGSSGSPVFSADLDLIGLHHAAEPGTEPTYNQAVPLWRIARAIAAVPGQP